MMIGWEPDGCGWEGIPGRGGGGAAEGPVTPCLALGPDGPQSVCTGGPEARGWSLEGEEV